MLPQIRNHRSCLDNDWLDVDNFILLPKSKAFGSSPDHVPAPEHTGLADEDPKSRSRDARHASSPPIRNAHDAPPVRLHAVGANDVHDQALVCTNCGLIANESVGVV